MDEKLRAAELEISVERAKMARQKAELEELRDNLDSQRQLYESTGTIPPPGAPRRRWLSKLGHRRQRQRVTVSPSPSERAGVRVS